MALTHNSTVNKNEPNWGNLDKTKLPRVAFADRGTPDKKSTWKFPHHWVSNAVDKNKDGVIDGGNMFLHRKGLDAAWAASQGARSGKKASPKVIAHLRRHFADLNIKKAIFNGKEYDVSIHDGELILNKLLMLDDLL